MRFIILCIMTYIMMVVALVERISSLFSFNNVLLKSTMVAVFVGIGIKLFEKITIKDKHVPLIIAVPILIFALFISVWIQVK